MVCPDVDVEPLRARVEQTSEDEVFAFLRVRCGGIRVQKTNRAASGMVD